MRGVTRATILCNAVKYAVTTLQRERCTADVSSSHHKCAPRQHGVATPYQEHVMTSLPAAARVSGAAAVALALSSLSGCYYVGPYPYGYYGAAPYPSPYATSGVPQGAVATGQYGAPAGPDDQTDDADPNASAANGTAAPLPRGAQPGMQPGAPEDAQAQQALQGPPPAGGYAPPPVAAAPAYYPAYPAAYPAYPAYYPPYYGYGYGPGWWGPGVALNFGFYGHYGYGHYGYGHYGHYHH
jgi:hypothetical protein